MSAPTDLAGRVGAVLAAESGLDRIVLALSGGRDSIVLLDVLAGLCGASGLPLVAVHVNHGLHPDAGRWAEFCRARCEALGVPLTVVPLGRRPAAGDSLEAWARRERYAALAACMRRGDALLTAHHAADRAETVLLALLRGAGSHGLRGFAPRRPFPPGVLLRPLADCPAPALAAHAARRGLAWVEDPANRDPRHPRNWLRHAWLPPLRERWPGLDATLGQVAVLQAQTAGLLDALADADLPPGAGPLPLAALAPLDAARRANAVRRWIRRAGVPAPGRDVLAQILRQGLEARPDSALRIRWNGAELRRHAGRLYLLAPLPPPPPAGERWAWQPPADLALPGGTLRAVPAPGGLRVPAGVGLAVGFRAGGERVRLPGRAHRTPLKELFRAAGMPPWVRARTPIVYADGQPAAVPGLGAFEPWVAAGGEAGLGIAWDPHGS